MCGIVGIWKLDGTKVDEEEINPLTDALAHRGPDGRGVYLDRDFSLGLGHRRLAIFDLSERGRQPMSYANGRYWITYNGEIYNFIELKIELESLGYSFRSASDTEVILAAYDRWGEECQYKFNGMWALAIWDKKDKKLFLSRDRFGIKPLHYYYDGKIFLFSSELKGFLALPNFKQEISQEFIIQELTDPRKTIGKEDCMLKGVKKLLAGHCLSLTLDKRIKIKRWWNTLEHIEEAPKEFSAQVEKFREIFFDACNIRMRSDVPIGTALSGGLDSTSVLSTMALLKEQSNNGVRQNTDWQKAFVATFKGTEQDERKLAEDVIKKINGQGVFVEVNMEDAIEHIEQVIFQFEKIYCEIPVGPWIIYQAMRKKGIVVSLDGHGGDELFGGYHHHLEWAMRDTVWPIPRPFRLLSLRRMLTKMYPNQLDVSMPTIPYLWKRKVYKSKPENYPALIADQPLMKNFDSLTRGLYTDTHFFLLPNNLHYYDRPSMGHGVEVRTPFLDWRLVCYAFSLPSSSKIGGGFTKRIVREAMKEILPENVRTRAIKLGFGNPRREWYKKEKMKRFFLDSVSSRTFQECDFWDGVKIKNTVEEVYREQSLDKNLGKVAYVERCIQAMFLIKAFRVKRSKTAELV